LIINTQTFTQSILILRTIMQGIVKVDNDIFKTFIVTDNVEKLHSFANQPAVIRSDGTKAYYKEGELHSFVVDGKHHPAITYADGSKYYYKEGKRHSFIIDGKIHPAVVNADGTEEYYKEGKQHSFMIDGKPQPAVVNADSYKAYYKEGNRHSFIIDGIIHPAVVKSDGRKSYYKDGKKTSLDVLEQENNQSIDIAKLSADKQKLVREFIKFIEQ